MRRLRLEGYAAVDAQFLLVLELLVVAHHEVGVVVVLVVGGILGVDPVLHEYDGVDAGNAAQIEILRRETHIADHLAG